MGIFNFTLLIKVSDFDNYAQEYFGFNANLNYLDAVQYLIRQIKPYEIIS
jgi:hypothetical protein